MISHAACVGGSGAVGFYNQESLLVAVGMVSGGGMLGAFSAVLTMVGSGDAVLYEGQALEIIDRRKLDDGSMLILGRLPNGRLVFTFGNMLRCQ